MSVLSKAKVKKEKSTYKRGFLGTSRGTIYPKGRYGLELEVEGNNITAPSEEWHAVNDGSLRGQSTEYVLRSPIDFEPAKTAINNLFEQTLGRGMTYKDSNRTSFHVHLNVSDFNIIRVANTITLYGIFENLLVNWCGPYRVGNLFAQRLCDVKWSIKEIATCLRDNSFRSFSNEVRYMGLNLASINKFGSLEFRTMRGITNPQDGVTWLTLINKIYEASERFQDPSEVVADFSGQEQLMARKVFGDELWNMLIKHTQEIGEDPVQHLWDGVRQVQEIAYAVNWQELRDDLKAPYIPNPFEKEKGFETPPRRLIDPDVWGRADERAGIPPARRGLRANLVNGRIVVE